ncbi:uncharacterized protein LOC111871108 isoform X2 [Cryptotermes secundus]|uniref:uncharacterized protein LOC111871108 isoform X2 n=1 Tax=Cryptotermes secundus TaxID=105785 RepID=UPI001454E2DB|nr:uncharacterized protein LOC111871108 isoform X2 [Cryptotermes secundus]
MRDLLNNKIRKIPKYCRRLLEPVKRIWVVALVSKTSILARLVVSGVLASYGVLLVSLVEETEVSLREALWTPVTYVVTCCLANPLCKRLSDKKRGQGSRLLASTGILVAAGGIATTTLLHTSRLQILSYGFLGGLGTSLVLTQVEIILHCHYPWRSAGPPLVIPQLGSALAHFSMPLLLLAFMSLYGSRQAHLLQAGLVLQGFLGAVTISPPKQRLPPVSRYHSRPRAYTFVESEGLPTARRDINISDSCTGRNSLANITSGSSWRNCASRNDSPQLTNYSSKQLVILESNSRCNKKGIDILPKIPEESEESSDSEFTDTRENASAVSNDLMLTDNTLHYGARSVDSFLNTDEMNIKLIDNCIENKRWSIGTVEEMVSFCVENGLAKYKSISDDNNNNDNNNRDNEIEENKSFNKTLGSSGLELDRQAIRGTLNALPVNSALWTTNSLNVDNTDVSEFGSLQSNSIDIPNVLCAQKTDCVTRKVRSLENIVPVCDKLNLINQSDAFKEVILLSNMSSDCIPPSDKLSKSENELTTYVHNMKKPHENKCVLKRSSTGSFEQMLSTNGTSFSVDDQRGQSSDKYQKCHSTEQRDSNRSIDYIGISENLQSNDSFAFQAPKDQRNTNTNITKTVKQHNEVNQIVLSSLDSVESENPLWTAKLISSETTAVDSASDSYQGSNSLRRWYRYHSSLSHVLRRLTLSCSCHINHCHNSQRYLRKHFISLYWNIPEVIRIPYFFPSLLLRLTQRICPMGFAALSPLLAKRMIDGCTKEEAVFSVSISGFVWLCFLLVTPWCSKIPPSKHKYLFAAGNILSAYGLHLLSKAKSHDTLTISCGIFGLGLGATMVTSNIVMRDALETWNLDKVDVILDLMSGVLILIAGSLMDLILKAQDGLTSCFTLLALVYLVTGTTWLLRPLITRLRCHHHAYRVWSTNGGHLLTSG